MDERTIDALGELVALRLNDPAERSRVAKAAAAADLFDELDPPPGRTINRRAVGTTWSYYDGSVKAAERDLAVAKKRAATLPPGQRDAHSISMAETALTRARNGADEAQRQLIAGVARGAPQWTTEVPMSLAEAADAEERSDRSRRAAVEAAAEHGVAEAPSAIESELRETRRELQRLRAQLGAKT